VDQALSIDFAWQEAPEHQAGPLATIEALVSAQKGQVQISRQGDMTTMTLVIPQGRRSTILVIEDNASLLQLYGRYLTADHYRILRAETGEEGLVLARTESPDVVLLDVMMRGMDGWEVLQRLRAHAETHAVPVIICSVLPERDLALSLGADAFLTKPIARFDLLDAIQRCLREPRNVGPRHPEAP
jgi:CheY-like chemotaxis protein